MRVLITFNVITIINTTIIIKLDLKSVIFIFYVNTKINE